MLSENPSFLKLITDQELGAFIKEKVKKYVQALMHYDPRKRIEMMDHILKRKRVIKLIEDHKKRHLEKMSKSIIKDPKQLIKLSKTYTNLFNTDNSLQTLETIQISDLPTDLHVDYYRAKASLLTKTNYNEAISAYEQALGICKSLRGGEDTVEFAQSLADLGNAYQDTCKPDYEKAIELPQQSTLIIGRIH